MLTPSKRFAAGLGFAVLSAAAVAFAVPATAHNTLPSTSGGVTASQSSAGAAPSAPAAREPRYCFIETPTGSHIERKTCKTAREWQRDGVDINQG